MFLAEIVSISTVYYRSTEITAESSKHLELAGKCNLHITMKYLVLLPKRLITNFKWTVVWDSSMEEKAPQVFV